MQVTGDRRAGDAAMQAGQVGREIVKFTETVAVNRAYSVKAFADEAKAVDWLVGQA